MTAWFGLAKFVLLTASLFAMATAIAMQLGYPHLRERLGRVEPARRARLLTLLSIAPAAVAVLHTTLCFVPGLFTSAFPALDHCAHHAHGDHPHLCFAHLPGGTGTAIGWVVVGIALGAVAFPMAREVARLARLRRLLAAMVRTARPGALPATLILSTEVPLAAATLLSRRVLLSSRLVSELSPELLAAVVEHEHAHVRRRDPLRLTVARVVSVFHLPSVRRVLLADLDLACEQACDEEAGRRVEDRLTVARALVAVERLFAPPGMELGSLAAGFGGSNVVARVESLLSPPLPRGQGWVERYAVTLLVLASAALTDPLHHVAEAVVGLVA